MKHLKSILALTAVATLGAPAVGVARDDADIFPGDVQSFSTVYKADGSVEKGKVSPSHRAFVDRLLATEAKAGVIEADTSGYLAEQSSRAGFTAPKTRLAKFAGGRANLGAVTVKQIRRADGTRFEERGYVVEIATGRLRKITIDAARRLSADPRGGTPGLQYVYQTAVIPAHVTVSDYPAP